ncbi:NHL repeat-containing protein [Acidocella facilis]|uniref:hypothetical protein n=1 Tax=Acidocella facilis TaxID=525 RepID=UPI00047ADB15|nr:hypothetical protein [Acidocella facilis]
MPSRTLLTLFGLTLALPAYAQTDHPGPGYLGGLKHERLITSTVPANGDQNPYAMAVSPVSAGSLQKGDLLADNFNNKANLQGTGTTIIDYRPATKQTTTFATLPAKLAGCPGGVGLSTAMAVLKSGWVIVGSAPSTDGTTKTLGKGCLILLDSSGKLAGTLAGPDIDDPWGNMAWIDEGDKATLFLSNAGFGIGAPGQPVQNTATVLRLELNIPAGKPPEVTSQTVISTGFGAQADASVFLVGPTGLALGKDGTLYVSDAIGNRIVKITDAATRTDSAGTGTEVSKGGLLNRPLALTMAPNGNLIAVNGLDGRAVEIDPASGQQIGDKWLDKDQAQTPPGSGDLFGLVTTPDGKGLYYVEDDMNTVQLAQ